jgi:hypothetical protein
VALSERSVHSRIELEATVCGRLSEAVGVVAQIAKVFEDTLTAARDAEIKVEMSAVQWRLLEAHRGPVHCRLTNKGGIRSALLSQTMALIIWSIVPTAALRECNMHTVVKRATFSCQ